MKPFQQSHVIPLAIACVLLTLFMIAVVFLSGMAAVAPPALGGSPGSLGGPAANLAHTRQALDTLTLWRQTQDAPQRLPLAPVAAASAPFPGAALPAFDANARFLLTTVVHGEGGRASAIINDQLVHGGEHLDRSTEVLAIGATTVRIRRDGQTFVLVMQAPPGDLPASEGEAR